MTPLPQVRSASPGDGSWNGVYRRGEIYGTDRARRDPARCGAPAAAGEWLLTFWLGPRCSVAGRTTLRVLGPSSHAISRPGAGRHRSIGLAASVWKGRLTFRPVRADS